jgi:hypothetical protein
MPCLAKAMDEKILRQVQASIAAKKVSIPEEEARDLAKRALQFKNERGRLPDINSPMPGKSAWPKAWQRSPLSRSEGKARRKEHSANG